MALNVSEESAAAIVERQPATSATVPIQGVVDGRKVSSRWTGVLLALAGLVIIVGSFRSWTEVRFTQFDRTPAGGVAKFVSNFSTAGTGEFQDGNITAALGGLLLVLAALILIRQGRMWVVLIGAAASTVSAVVARIDMGAVHARNSDTLGFTYQVGSGLRLVLISSLLSIGVCILAMYIRQSRD